MLADELRECAKKKSSHPFWLDQAAQLMVQAAAAIDAANEALTPAPQPSDAAWTTHTRDADGNPCVAEHSRVVGGVLCRWWGDGPAPAGVAMIDRATDQQSVRADLEQIAEKYKSALDGLSMQDAPQPTDGTGKQSMQACTNEKQTLVQLTGRQADGLISATKALLDSVCPKCSGTGKEVVAEKTSWDGMTPYHYVTFCSACDGGRTADKSSDTPARGLHFDED
jgi:hypothetical protein